MQIISGFFKIILFTIIFIISSLVVVRASDVSKKTTVAVFVRQGCEHCKNEEDFLSQLSSEVDSIEVKLYRLENIDDRKIWDDLTTRLKISKVTPITVIGDKYIIGFDNENNTGKDIKNLIFQAQKSNTKTNIDNGNLIENRQADYCPDDGSRPCVIDKKPAYFVSLPLVGKIDANKYPLFILSALLGFVDGFNPCAMWVLVTFLIILIEIGDRKKMLVFAGTFILAEAIMYGLILTVWFKTWDFVRLDTFITPLVGLVSIIGGIFFIKEWRKKELECKVTNIDQRAKTVTKIKQLANNKLTILTFLGILTVAFSVNIIEFACSVGIPQTFTKILDLNNLPLIQWVVLIVVYILFYLIDDLFVFGLALWGAEHIGLTTKYSKFSNLVGGVVMIILGLVLIFKSQLLLF